MEDNSPGHTCKQNSKDPDAGAATCCWFGIVMSAFEDPLFQMPMPLPRNQPSFLTVVIEPTADEPGISCNEMVGHSDSWSN
jgi:hypothetical protein